MQGFYGSVGAGCRACPSGASCCVCGNQSAAAAAANYKRFGRPCAECLHGGAVPIANPGFLLALERDGVATTVACHNVKACSGGAANACGPGYGYNR